MIDLSFTGLDNLSRELIDTQVDTLVKDYEIDVSISRASKDPESKVCRIDLLMNDNRSTVIAHPDEIYVALSAVIGTLKLSL